MQIEPFRDMSWIWRRQTSVWPMPRTDHSRNAGERHRGVFDLQFHMFGLLDGITKSGQWDWEKESTGQLHIDLGLSYGLCFFPFGLFSLPLHLLHCFLFTFVWLGFLTRAQPNRVCQHAGRLLFLVYCTDNTCCTRFPRDEEEQKARARR